jgi:Tol biopolymer transport system component
MSSESSLAAVDLTPASSPRPKVAFTLALLAVSGSTIAWELPMGGLWIGLPLALAAIVLGLQARRERVSAGLATAAVAIAGLCIAQMVAWTAVSIADAKSRIVWSSVDPEGTQQRLVTAQPNGHDRHWLTDPAPHTQDIDAQFSPDGTRVAFERDLNDGETSQVVLIGADGKHERVLDLGCVDPCLVDISPTWFPGGRRIVFSRVSGPIVGPNAASVLLWSADTDGSGGRRVSQPGIEGTYEDSYARYSPDGRYIVFTRLRLNPDNMAVFRMDADGTHVRQLTPWSLNADLADLSPATSGPTKDLIAFETYGHGETPEGKTQNIATVPSTCTSLSACGARTRYLTHLQGGPRASFNPAWSPSGRRIAYTEFRGEDANHPCCIGDIYTMRLDGSHRKPVSTSPRFEFRPDWGKAR